MPRPAWPRQRKKADEEAKKKADDEARKKTEAEAKAKAEEEARNKAQQQAAAPAPQPPGYVDGGLWTWRFDRSPLFFAYAGSQRISGPSFSWPFKCDVS